MSFPFVERQAIFYRDGGCIATQPAWFGVDVAPDVCRSGFGAEIDWNALWMMEGDHVTDDAGIRRDSRAFGVTVCPWHHRLSQRWRIDSKAHRVKIRDRLRVLYPKEWAREGGLGSQAGGRC